MLQPQEVTSFGKNTISEKKKTTQNKQPNQNIKKDVHLVYKF
jgi:hypothetical protein